MENKRALVVGGSGYVGRELVELLTNHGYMVMSLSRGGQYLPNATVIKGSALDIGLMEKLVGDFDIVIYLAAVIRAFNKRLYEENVVGADVLCESMILSTNTPELIYFSTQNTSLAKTGPYGNSKRRAEAIVRKRLPRAVILRPNYVYGLDCDNDFARLAKIIHVLRICPVLAGGRTKFFPVHKSDLARIVVEEILYALESFVGSTVDVSGEDSISINDIVNYYSQIIPQKFMRVNVPFTLLKIMKPLIPFDVDGFNLSRISKQGKCFLAKSDIYKDLSMIAQQAS